MSSEHVCLIMKMMMVVVVVVVGGVVHCHMRTGEREKKSYDCCHDSFLFQTRCLLLEILSFM